MQPATIKWLDAVLRVNTLTGAMNVAHPTYDGHEGLDARDRLPAFGAELGSESSCMGTCERRANP